MKKILIYLLSMTLSGVTTAAVSQRTSDILPILSREEISTKYNGVSLFKTTEAEQQWLNDKKYLMLAIVAPDNPPHDVTIVSGKYEGVTADVVGLLSSILGIPIVAQRYENRSVALQAIRRGDADLIGTANSYEAFQDLLLTKSYIKDSPVLFLRHGVNIDNVKSIAVPQNYLPDELFNSLFHNKKITTYPTNYSAFASVAYKRNDAVLIDLLSANFFVNKFYLENVKFGERVKFNSYGFSFALSPKNKKLQHIINKAIDAIPTTSIKAIYQRWAGGGISLAEGAPILTVEEKNFLESKKIVTMAVNDRIPPMGFIDKDGYYRGIIADLVESIQLRLGIKIKLLVMDDLGKQLSAVNSGEADLSIASPNRKYEQSLVFTRAFVHDPLVYVIRPENYYQYQSIADVLQHGQLALVSNTVAEKVIDDVRRKDANTKNIRAKFFDKYDNALACVANRLCTAAVLPLRPAQYFINSNYPEALEIGGELYDSQPVSAAFTANDNNKMLIDIFDKVLASIPPNELEVLSSRWRVSAKKEIVTLEDVFHQFSFEIITITISLLMTASWAFLLRRQNLAKIRAQHALKQQLKFMDDLIDSIPHPIFARDRNNRFILCNKSYSDFMGIEKKVMLGSDIVELPISDKSKNELRDIYKSLHENGANYNGDHYLTLANGRAFHIYYWLHIYRDLSNENSGIIGGWLDISERHRLMEELAEASQRAAIANKAKTKFLATMSHEIRTPMNAIIGLLELTLRKGGINSDASEAIEIALKSSRELLGLIGDILDISKIESGKLELAPSPQSIAELSHAVINVFTANAREKGLYLSCSIESDQMVLIDSMRYKQIVSNLISNAIKFTKQGGVDLSLSLLTEMSDCLITIKIADTGIGINLEDQARLFQPFSQAEHFNEEYRSGTGLGLLICRTLCEMMGGHLALVSTKDIGTTITVSLRVPLVAPVVSESCVIPELMNTSPDFANASKILIIDDHPTNRLLVSQQLSFLGHEVKMAESGRDALYQLADKRFDFIITDFNMPDINGLEFTTLYRQQEQKEQRERCIIIGLTADARKEQIQRAIEVGMDDCLFKPVSLDEIKDCLAVHYRKPVSANHKAVVELAARIDLVLGGLATNNTELMHPLIQEFLKATNDDIAMLSIASKDDDSRRFLDHLHRIKGGARIIGADRLVECCNQWERSPRLNWCMPSALRQIEEIYNEVKEAVLYWQETRGIGEL